jgi:K+-sensing histidine kinase KdpD
LEAEARLWLWFTGALALSTIGAAILAYFMPFPSDAGPAKLLQLLTSKVVVLAVLITATVWCGRIYKGTKHQASMNDHRANALKTFQAFVKSTSDEATRNAVLLETTRSIFAVGQSGYLDGAAQQDDGSTKVLEIIKNATGSK